jgi:hypothetical protein
MTTISDLHRSISKLSNEEAFSLIRELRALRRIPKPVKKRSPKKAKAKAPKQLTIDDLINNLSAEQAANLLKKMKEKG